MADPRMLVLDLDGTTLRHDGTLADVDIAAAKRLKEAGIPVAIATGRLYTGTAWVAEALGIEGNVAVMNGSELVDVATHRTTSGRYVDAAARARARAVFAAHDLPAFLFGSRRIHHGLLDDKHTSYLGIWTEDLIAHEDLYAASHWDDSDILAVCSVGDQAQIEAAGRALGELPEHLGLVGFNTFHGDRFVQLTSTTYDKGTAVKQLAQDRGLDVSEVVAVGDWINDLPMFDAAGHPYAMNHAVDGLKERATGVLDAGREGGAIAEVARRVWGL